MRSNALVLAKSGKRGPALSRGAPALRCPVRGCGGPLAREGRTLRCPRGHAFDLAKSGYLNLLQPQERRSRRPGDSRDAALARRRLFAAGVFDPLLAALEEEIAALSLPPGPAVLDVGCGEGSVLRRLASGREIAPCGVDISAEAVDLAARALPEGTWVVANADRSLPWIDGSFDLALSVAARRNPPELRRLLAQGGRAIVAVPGEDDLIELRQAVLGEGVRRERLAGVLEEMAPDFEPENRRTVRHVARLPPDALHDLLAATYRGARESERGRVEGLGALEVTLSFDLAVLRPRGGSRQETSGRVRGLQT